MKTVSFLVMDDFEKMVARRAIRFQPLSPIFRIRVARYFLSGTCIFTVPEMCFDLLKPDHPLLPGGNAIYVGHGWAWSRLYMRLFLRHNLQLPTDFVNYLQARGYAPAEKLNAADKAFLTDNFKLES
jgi:hypothetical protein